MPCTDVTEVLELHVDEDDRVLDYTLKKRTCGAEIGDASLLLELVRGLDADGLEQIGAEDVLARYAPAQAEEFLFFKHLVALRQGARIYAGAERGRPSDPCVIESISASERGFALRVLVAVELLTEEIRACGNCGGCGSKKKARSLAAS